MSSQELDARRPWRYSQPWVRPFVHRAQAGLGPGARILDVGSGRTPILRTCQRPEDCHYVGLDVSESELLAADEGAYDEIVVGDITRRDPALVGGFDAAVSWQVFEHVKPIEDGFENVRAYLRDGGHMVAMLSGTFASFALISRVVPHRLAVYAMDKLLDIPPESRFPTHYHHCWDSALRRALSAWSEVEVVPLFRGARYFEFSRVLERAYLAYENWAEHGERNNLATHYLVRAVK